MENISNLQLLYSDDMLKVYQDLILKGLSVQAGNRKQLGAMLPFSFSYVDENSNFVASIYGTTLYGGMHIDTLYVENNYRRKGIGKALIANAEKLALERKCVFSYLETMDFEAKPFYEKLGYTVEYIREGYHNNSIMYLMRKKL